MSVSYQQLLHNVALRMSALAGTQVVQVNASYDTATLVAGNFKSADWPFNSFRDSILMAVSDFSWAIADTGKHPWRQTPLLAAFTGTLASHATLPAFSSTGEPIIGIFGSAYDSTDNTELEERPLSVVQRLARETWRTRPLYYYALDGNRIVHTRPLVRLECCVYDRSDQLILFTAGGNMPLPDPLELGVTARTISIMTRDGAFAQQAKDYTDFAEQQLARIRGGLTAVPNKAI